MAVPIVKFSIFPLVRTIGTAVIALLLIWTVHYRGGLALSPEKDLISNVHPLSTVTGLILLNGEGKNICGIL
ncbi:putative transmembrane ascorbate ferrireductase 2-like [Dorcoceras hygrometricum]|uniref:Putative transmembrane ascorbate ferrireductase 2-like n=1 Tax=Dorcoceras hygrometricum TaxID=472368 RepID=A0A2Z6ZVP2_9LAMI|nr:putative transmembrane ascorbate ferrireductase 2-like [Dorcoceras hygrometricum]